METGARADTAVSDLNAEPETGSEGGAGGDARSAAAVQLHSLELLLEAALVAVPQPLLEQSIAQCGRGQVGSAAGGSLPRQWAASMGCAVVSDKVAQCLHKLQTHRAQVQSLPM